MTPTPRSRHLMPPEHLEAAIALHPPVPFDRDRLADDLFMPSYCPVGERLYRDRLDVMVSSYRFTVDPGGQTVTTHHECPVCGTSWTQSGWPAVMIGGTPEAAVRRAS